MILSENLPADWIDLDHGDAFVVRESLLRHITLPIITHNKNGYEVLGKFVNTSVSGDHLNYQHPGGFPSLTKLLAEKHNVKQEQIVVCSGAKQGLAASFFALKRLGYKTLTTQEPYWKLIKPLAEDYTGLELGYDDYDGTRAASLLVNPNNPDGAYKSNSDMTELCRKKASRDIPVIHDAVYSNPVYCDESVREFPVFGDIQIHSCSKAFGLSSLRLGYMVVKNERFLKPLLDYMETMTVGTSITSQILFYELLRSIDMFPSTYQKFLTDARNALYQGKFLMRTLNKDILEVPDSFEQSSSPFLFARLKKKDAFEKAKVKVSYYPNDMIRVNISASKSKLIEAIRRLNQQQ